MCLLQVSHWRSRSHRLSQKEMNEPSQLSHFLEAHKKNEPQPHCYGEEERGICREKWFCCCRCLGGREPFFGKHVFSRHGEAVYPVPCYHCHLQAKLPDGPAWTSRHSCFQHSPLLFPQFSGNLRSPQNTCTIHYYLWQPNWRKRHPRPFMVNSDPNLPANKEEWHLKFSREYHGVSGSIWAFHTYRTPIECRHSLL